MGWYTITECRGPTDQRVVFDGKASLEAVLSAMAQLHNATGSRVIVTRGKGTLGKFVADTGEFYPRPHRHPGPVSGCLVCSTIRGLGV